MMTIRKLHIQKGVFVIALVATLGSLYYSTFGDPVANFFDGNLFRTNMGIAPCVLCWYTRVLMYPLVLISLYSILTKDEKGMRYTLLLAVPGLVLGVAHTVIEKSNGLLDQAMCTEFNPCASGGLQYFGFLSMPMFSVIAFGLIVLAGGFYYKQR